MQRLALVQGLLSELRSLLVEDSVLVLLPWAAYNLNMGKYISGCRNSYQRDESQIDHWWRARSSNT